MKIQIRRAVEEDLTGILSLYRFLHPADPGLDPHEDSVRQHWKMISEDPRLRYFVAEVDKTIVASCTLALIPNLTRQLRPYAIIENVVTDPDHRKQGMATRVLRRALEDAWEEGCYKVMLSSGSKQEETLRLYEGVGFVRGVKTGFVAYPPSLVRKCCKPSSVVGVAAEGEKIAGS